MENKIKYVKFCRALADIYEKEHYKKNPLWYGGNINALRNIANYIESGELNGDTMPRAEQYVEEQPNWELQKRIQYSLDEQDEIQEDATSMEEKMEALTMTEAVERSRNMQEEGKKIRKKLQLELIEDMEEYARCINSIEEQRTILDFLKHYSSIIRNRVKW